MKTFKKKTSQVLAFSSISQGQEYSFEKTLTEGDIGGFAKLTGDHNPLHTDDVYARKTPFKKKVCHGMFLGSLFSRLVGMYCPGKEALYLTQALEFKRPVFAGDKLTVKGIVMDKSESTKIIALKTLILVEGKVVVSGEAKVLFRGEI